MDVKDDKQRELPLVVPPRILRLKQVPNLTGLCRSSIYQLQAQKRFPQSVKISARAVGWVESAVQRWVEEKAQQSQR